MPPVAYYSMIKAHDAGFRFGVRRQMVMDTLERGIKPMARAYGITVKTLRKWVRRYKAKGVAGLEEQSRAPKRIPHKKSKEIEQKVIKLKKQLKGYGVGRMVKEFDVNCGKGADLRIAREHGLLKRRKKKRQRRNDLREEKAKYRIGEVSCADTKDLSDVAAYWTQMQKLRLPSWQYTFREVKSGLMFLGYARELSLLHATVFAEQVYESLKKYGIRCEGSRCQTDGGSEFIGSWHAKKKSAFIQALEERKVKHFQIPKVTYNADVETVHNTIELEFFDIEQFKNQENFIEKASTYQRWYNLYRKNSSKRDRSPLEIIQESEPQINPQVAMLPALNLDKLVSGRIDLLESTAIPQGGYHVPGQAFTLSDRP